MSAVTYRKFVSYLWIPLVLIMLIPVFRHAGSHGVVIPADGVQGTLLVGRGSLDSLLALSLGKPVIVNFWATWCTPCVGELPHLDNVYRTMDGSVSVIAVDIGDPELETLIKFREHLLVSIPVVWLSMNDAAALKDDWGIADVLPVTIILDSFGREIQKIAGIRDEAFFREAVSGVIPVDTIPEDTTEHSLHINVVGIPGDSITELLLDTSLQLAGQENTDFFDPLTASDSLLMESLYLPMTGYPYAQPCVGGMCGRPAHTPEELLQAITNLTP